MRVACVGDIMLDVIVSTERPLAVDDDTEATIAFSPGGQAANVAAWVVALGGEAVVFGPRGPGAGALAVASLEERGVTVVGPSVPRSGAVVSLVAEGRRSLASDGGSPSWLDEVAPGPWLDDVDWLFVSGYALLRAADPARLVALASGMRVAVDLSSAAMIEEYGADRFRALWQSLSPAVVFANDDEWSVCGAPFDGTLVLKHGAGGATFDGVHQPARPADVVDVTGAGDALAAGWFVSGVELAMQTAADCVEQVGAQPHPA
ncbi:MAG TPA: carbohydrate kinase family protein [Nocardioidaceae bacterium]|nr:carbohydrate kinase family protein [Nocardioidaceae bacterium]